MIVEKDLRKLLHQLIKEETAHIKLGDSDVTVHIFDHSTRIFLSSAIYFGGDFIPQSVKTGLTKKPRFDDGHLESTFGIDEQQGRISLNYIGRLDHLKKRMFIDLLEEFSALADEWRFFLDEHDKNDFVHVRTPKNPSS